MNGDIVPWYMIAKTENGFISSDKYCGYPCCDTDMGKATHFIDVGDIQSTFKSLQERYGYRELLVYSVSHTLISID